VVKAQLENGYTRIANELLEGFCCAKIRQNEFKILLALMRLSYGWAQKDTGDRAGISEMRKLTGLPNNQIYEAVKGLRASGVVLVEKQRQNIYKINTQLDQWQLVSIVDQSTNLTSQQFGLVNNPDYAVVNNPDYAVVNNPDYAVVNNPDYEHPLKPSSSAGLQPPKEIKETKEIKERRKEKEQTSFPSDENLISYQPQPTDGQTADNDVVSEWLKALGAFQFTEVEKMNIKTLCESGCNAIDAENARIKNQKFYGVSSEWGRRQITKQRDTRIKDAENYDPDIY